MKRALFGMAVLALVLSVPAHHGEVQAGRGGFSELMFCETAYHDVYNPNYDICLCEVTNCYSMETSLLISSEVGACDCGFLPG